MVVPKLSPSALFAKQSSASFNIVACGSDAKSGAAVSDNSRKLNSIESFADNKGGSSVLLCDGCAMRSLSLCSDATNPLPAPELRNSANMILQSTVHRAPARKIVCHPKEWSDSITVICEGTAVSSISTASGKRQILSVLLPGDIVSLSNLYATRIGYTTETVTTVTYRKFSRKKMQEYLSTYPAALEKIIEVISRESSRANKLLLDIGCRSSEERIASFILDFSSRTQSIDCADEYMLGFPFRLHHLAEALGLSAVYTSKAIAKLERAGLIKLKLRTLHIKSIKRLQEFAGAA